MPNYNTGIDLSSVSISEATYMLNSFIEESINDIHTRCLLTDKRSIQESGVLYFTEENETGKQKLGEKIKQIIKTVWDAIVGIFKKLRDFFKDMIEKMKEFFSKIQQKFFGKKEDKKEEPKSTEKTAEMSNKKINTVQGEDGLHQAAQKELIQYMKDLPDNVFRDSIDKNVNTYYNNEMFINPSGMLSDAAENLYTDGKEGYGYALRTLDRVRKFLKTPLSEFEINTRSISRGVVLDCAFGNFSGYYRSIDRNFKYAEKIFDDLSKNVDKLEQRALPLLKELLKCTTTCSKMYSNIMIHNSKELIKVVHYIYNNYDRDGVSVKESVDWSSIL